MSSTNNKLQALKFVRMTCLYLVRFFKVSIKGLGFVDTYFQLKQPDHPFFLSFLCDFFHLQYALLVLGILGIA